MPKGRTPIVAVILFGLRLVGKTAATLTAPAAS